MIGLVPRVALAALIALAGAAAVALAAGSGRDGPPAGGSAGDRWGSLRPSPFARTEVGGARIGRHVYVVGGFVPSGGGTGRLARYDIRRDRWRRLAPLPIEVHHPGVTAYRGRLYVHGGMRTGAPARRQGPSARLYRYVPRKDRWRRMSDSDVPRMAHGFERVGNRLYAVGGNRDGRDLSSVEAYSPRRDRWRRLRRMPGPRHHVGTAALGRELYVVAGRAEGRNVDLVHRFDPSAGRRGRWQRLASVDVERSGHMAVAVRGSVVAVGGEELGGGETIAEVERYDPASDTWSRLPSMTTPRHGLAVVQRRGRIYAIEGGPRPGLAYSSANEFLDLR